MQVITAETVSRDFEQEKLKLIKQTVARGTTDLEFELFIHACKRTGLDPLMKQIYAIKRKNNKTNTDEMSIQTGIDGYRLIADRTGKYAGSDEPVYQIAEDGFPDVASVTVYKLVEGQRCAFSSSARWSEYVQEAGLMWKKMPFLMLAKCAEALALRKAFPAELSGVYTHEEMMQADTQAPRGAAVPSGQEMLAKLEAQETVAQVDGAGKASPASGTQQARDESEQPPSESTLAEYLDQFKLVESIKGWSEIMNAAMAQPWLAEEQKTLKDHSDRALKRLKDGGRKKT